MPRFYFDVRDGEKITLDKEGMIFEGIEGARDEALRALAELAKDVSPGAVRRRLAIEVRDETKQSLFVVAAMFEVAQLRRARP
jgi:hypothetical protein